RWPLRDEGFQSDLQPRDPAAEALRRVYHLAARREIESQADALGPRSHPSAPASRGEAVGCRARPIRAETGVERDAHHSESSSTTRRDPPRSGTSGGPPGPAEPPAIRTSSPAETPATPPIPIRGTFGRARATWYTMRTASGRIAGPERPPVPNEIR